jgi:hypothetical protein
LDFTPALAAAGCISQFFSEPLTSAFSAPGISQLSRQFAQNYPSTLKRVQELANRCIEERRLVHVDDVAAFEADECCVGPAE